ncbi:MAG: tetratricopeptide repeat protein [Candidatus Zipacnadales bacterium]
MYRTWTVVMLFAMALGAGGAWGQAPPPKLELTEEQRKAEEAFSVADGLFRKGFHDQALEKFVEFVDQWPQHANAALALFLAGECRYAQQRYQEALLYYQRVLEDYPQSEEIGVAAYRLAHAKYQTQDYAGAIAAFRDLLKRVPDTQYKPAALYWIGESHFSLKQYEQAIQAYEESRKLAPQGEFASWAIYSIGMSQLELGNGEAALQSFRTVIQDYGDSPVAAECELRVADALREAGRIEEAITAYENVLKRGEERLTAGALHGLAWSQFDQEQWAKARSTFERLLREYPNSAYTGGAQRGLANCLYHEKQYAEAAKAYEQVRNGAPTDLLPELIFWQAAALELAGDAEGASKLFRQLTEEHRDHPLATKAALRLADMAVASEDLQAAEAAYQAAVASNDPEMRTKGQLGLAWLAYQKGDRLAALAQYEQIVKENGNAEAGAIAAIQGAQIAFAEGDHAKTIALTDSFLQNHPTHQETPRAHCLRGLAFAARENVNQAIAELEQAIAAAPQADFTANALTSLFTLYRKAGKDAKAEEALERLKRDFPDVAVGAEVQYNAATALFEAGKYADAQKAYEATLKATDDPEICGAAQFGIGSTHFHEGQFEAALAAYRVVVDNYGQSAAAILAQRQIGACLLRLERYAEAAEALAKLVAEHPEHETAVQAQSELAYAYSKSGQEQKAQAIYEKLASGENVPSEQAADALLRLGEIAYGRGDYQSALSHYEALIEKHPTCELVDEAQYKRGWALLQLQRPGEAVEAFAKCLAANPNRSIAADCHLQIGVILADKGDTDGAIGELKPFLTDFKGELTAPFALLELAEAYLQKEDWSQARTALEAMPETSEKEMAARRELLLGIVLQRLNLPNEALAHLEKARSQGTEEIAARAHFELAAAQAASGAHGAAADSYLNVAILYANSPLAPEALYRAGQAFEAAGKPDDARKAYQSLTKEYPEASEWVERAKARLTAVGG